MSKSKRTDCAVFIDHKDRCPGYHEVIDGLTYHDALTVARECRRRYSGCDVSVFKTSTARLIKGAMDADYARLHPKE